MCLFDEYGKLLARCDIKDCPDIIAFCIFIEIDQTLRVAVERLGIEEATRLTKVSLRLHHEKERKRTHDDRQRQALRRFGRKRYHR